MGVGFQWQGHRILPWKYANSNSIFYLKKKKQKKNLPYQKKKKKKKKKEFKFVEKGTIKFYECLYPHD
jgi:ABC-type nitrate/sulfonate/bicarbonate transport system ATPase subunit